MCHEAYSLECDIRDRDVNSYDGDPLQQARPPHDAVYQIPLQPEKEERPSTIQLQGKGGGGVRG